MQKVKNFLNRAAPYIVLILIVLFCIAQYFAYAEAKYHGDINITEAAELREELIKLNGIGGVLADRIIERRPYQSWEDLQSRVDGIGAVKLRLLKDNFKLSQKRKE
jgi:DNA uptake protein ComE-like DNA-binding protein